MLRNSVFICLVLVTLAACSSGRGVVDGMYAPMGDRSIKVSDNFEYVGELLLYRPIYYVGQKDPYKKTPVNASVFVDRNHANRLVVIERWRADTQWVEPDGGLRAFDGVDFYAMAAKHSELDEPVKAFVTGKGYDLTAQEFYRYKLSQVINSKSLYVLSLYTGYDELQSEDFAEIKPYLRKIVTDSITIIGE